MCLVSSALPGLRAGSDKNATRPRWASNPGQPLAPACAPPGEPPVADVPVAHCGDRGALLPRRQRTRAQNRAQRIAAETTPGPPNPPGPTCPDGQLLRRIPTHQRRRRAATLLMQSTGALANETSQEIGGSCANTRGIRASCRRRRRPIRSVHAAAAQQAEGNSETCSPARRQFRRRAIRRSRVGVGGRSADARRRPYARRGTVRVLRGRTRGSRVAQRRGGVARLCPPDSLAPRSTKRGN